MAFFWLINPVNIGTVRLLPGESVNDAITDATAIRNAGGLLWPQGDPTVDAAAAIALNARVNRGSNEHELESIMQAAVDAVQLAEDAGSGGDVANIAALTAVTDLIEPDGARRFMASLRCQWVLDKTSTAPVDGITIIATLSGTGRWLRVLAHVPRWTDQVDWEVNATTGDNENPGTAALPLETVAEFCRRVRVLKYGTSFGPYQVKCQTSIPATDTFNLSSDILLTDAATNPANVGVPRTLVRIFSTVKTVLGSGTTSAFVAPVGNAKSTVSRVAGVFAPEDIIEFTSGPAAGKRVYAMSGGASAQTNPWLFDPFAPVFPTAGGGDTFDVIGLLDLNIQLPNAGGPQGILIDVDNFKLPPAAGPSGNSSWEFYGYQLRFLNCLLNVLPRPGMGARLRLGKFGSDSCGVMRAAQDFFLFERGTVISLMTSFRNVIFDVTQAQGIAFLSYDELQFGAIRMGNTAEEAEDAQGPVTGGYGPIRIFDWPDPIPANPYIATGGAGDPGAGFSCRRGAEFAFIADSAGNGVVGLSAVGHGLNISESSKCEMVNGSTANVTITGTAGGDLEIDADAPIPSIGAGGVPVVGAAITTWATLFGATYLGNAHNLVNGTRIVKTP